MLTGELLAFSQVLLIDITLASDNAVVVGLAAASVPRAQRRKVIIGGIGVAVLLRLGFALLATSLFKIIGLTLSGGLLLLWVAWKFYRDLRNGRHASAGEVKTQTVAKAIARVAIADLSMSLDNVLAVAGAAQGHSPWVLISGLGIAVLLMAVAANAIAGLLQHAPWLSYLGLAVVLFVALRMIWLGGGEVIGHFA
jgi:YjbE family integral membrane protein